MVMMDKRAYPNEEGFAYIPKSRDVRKWVQALREIYLKISLGAPRNEAKKIVVGGWEKLEQFEFESWMRYYEGGDQLKYKTASGNNFYVNERGDYLLPNPPNPAAPPVISTMPNMSSMRQDVKDVVDQKKPGLSESEQREANESFRRKLVSRLNSLEKYLGSTQGHIFAGDEYSNLLDSIFNLKKQIHTHNKFTLSAQTCLDLIVKEANILGRIGSPAASAVMVKVAQTMPAPPGIDAAPVPTDGAPVDPNAPPTVFPTPEMAPPSPLKEETKTGLEGFLQNLENAGITDIMNVEDGDEDEVDFDLDEVEFHPKQASSWGDLIVIEGQDAAPVTETAGKTEDTGVAPPVAKPQFDALVDSAFSHLTVNDLIDKLNDIDLIFKKREISNQLAMASVMMARLNLSANFPEFAEIQGKQLDAANYSASRMSSILTALRSSIGTSSIDLKTPNDTNDPEAQLLKRHLENEEEKEQQKKDIRKQVENNNLDTEKPEIEVEDAGTELAGPAPAAPPAAPQAPAARRNPLAQ